MKFQTSWLRTAVVVAGIVLLLFGAVQHLGLLEYSERSFIYGNAGDGFFNLWVMEHTVQNLAHGNLNLANGRIFWPECTHTFLWSDNLFVPAAMYGACKALTNNMWPAYWWTAMLLTALAFLAYGAFFGVLFRIAKSTRPSLPAWAALFVPAFVFVAVFSLSRLVYYSHFQNLSSFWLFTLLAGALSALYGYARWGLGVMAISQVLLLYSSPYFAVMGLCFILTWGVFQLCLSPRELWRLCRENSVMLLPAVLLFGVLAYWYLQVEKVAYESSYIYHLASQIEHLYIPVRGPVCEFWESTFGSLPDVQHESPAYLGAGVLLALVVVLLWRIRSVAMWLMRLLRAPYVWVLMALAVAARHLGGGAWRYWTCWLGTAVLVAVLVRVVGSLARRRPQAPLALAAGFLTVAAFLAYGIATGPRRYFLEQPINPSIWGILSLVVPGLSNMRSIGRMAVIGQGCILGLLFVGLLWGLARSKGKTRVAVAVVAGLLLGVQVAESFRAQPSMNHYPIEVETPLPDECKWFYRIEGSVVVFPTRPFHRNTSPMLYFNHFQDIQLMNGYSARSTPLWDHMMTLGAGGQEPTEAQLKCAESVGCRYAVIWKWSTSRTFEATLRSGPRRLCFENERLMVLAVSPPPPRCPGMRYKGKGVLAPITMEQESGMNERGE